MNNQKLAQAFLQLSQAFATIHEALLEQPLRVHSETTAEPSTPVETSPPAVSKTVPANTAPASASASGAGQFAAFADTLQFTAFADTLKSILQMVPPGALNTQLAQMIERYAPGAGAPGQGGIRKIPAEQYQNFLAEVRQAATALGGTAQ